MPFILKGTVQTFPRLMDSMLRDLRVRLCRRHSGCQPVDRCAPVTSEIVFSAPRRARPDHQPREMPVWFAGHRLSERVLPQACFLRRRNFYPESGFTPLPVHHCFPRSFVPVYLAGARFVFMRHNAHPSPLKPPYDGLFRGLEVHMVADEAVFLAQVSRRGRPLSRFRPVPSGILLQVRPRMWFYSGLLATKFDAAFMGGYLGLLRGFDP